MNREWYESKEGNDTYLDYRMPTESKMSIGQEIVTPESECASTTEYYNWGVSKKDYSLKNKKSKLHKKLMRKITYGVASVAMVASMAQTLTNAEPVGILSEQKVWFNIYDRDENYAKKGVIVVGGCDTLAGVGHVLPEFRHVDYNGNTVALEVTRSYGYNGKWVNANGYVLVDTYGSRDHAVYDSNGSLIHEWLDTRYSMAAISDNNTVFFQRNVRTDEGDTLRNSYYTINGSELCSIDCDASIYYNGMAIYGTPFRDGIALCNDATGILLIQENGNKERLVNWVVVSEERNIRDRFQVGKDGVIEGSDGRYVLSNVPCIISGNVSHGYFIVTDAVGNMALVNMDTGEMYKTRLQYGNADVDSIGYNKYVMYSDNEGDMIHLGTLMCSVEKNENKEKKYYLFDATKHCDEEGNRIGYLACYDAIYFEDYQYLVARDSADYFYIDLDGNKVSDYYKKASTFNDFGYALIQTQSGAFYVIDSEFNKIEEVYKIDDFNIKDIGEVFWVTCDEEPHSYYYGPNVSEK